MRELGRTSWGQAWLGALHAVDREGRLGRGREYACQGAVEHLAFGEAGRVTAEVRGPRPRPYRVRLDLAPLTEAQVGALLEEIARRPDWLDLLLAGRLPPGLERVLAAGRVRIFPASWRDVGMRCDCPDAAVPCEHVAAVLYRLAQHIDDDPMLLFAVRGLDLPRRLAALGAAGGLAPVALEDLVGKEVAGGGGGGGGARPADREIGRTVPRLLDHWPVLLPQRPPFFPDGDLAALYHRYLLTASAFWARPDDDDEEPPGDEAASAPQVAAFAEVPVPPWEVGGARVSLDHDGGFAEARLLDHAGECRHAFAKEVGLLAYAERPDCPVPALHHAYALARRLVIGGAVVPRLLHLGGETYRTRWQAAVQDPAVAEAVRALAADPAVASLVEYLPPPPPPPEESEAEYRARLGREVAAALEEPPASRDPAAEHTTSPRTAEPAGGPPPEAPRRRPRAAGPHDAVHALLGVFLRPMLLAGAEAVLAKAEHAAVRLLFLGRPVDLRGAGDAQLALAVQLWLRRLDLDDAEHRLLLQVDEVDDRPGAYALRLLVLREGAATPDALPVADVLDGSRGELLRLQVLRDVALLAEAYAPLGAYAKTDGHLVASLPLYGGDFAGFLFEVAPALRLSGVQLLLPRGLERAARPQLTAVVRGAGGEGGEPGAGGGAEGERKRPPGVLGLPALVDFDWQVAVGEGHVDAEEFRRLADAYEGIVRLRDGFVWLEPAATARLLRRLDAPPRPAPHVVAQSVLTESFQGASLFLTEEVRRLRDDLLAAPPAGEVELPGLRASLRPYQEVGFAWLRRNADAGLGSLLADDMGLGKTLQTIALLEHYRARGRWREAPALVVLPTSLLTNWQRELARFAPELRVAIFHGPGRGLRALAGAEVVLTSYGVVRSDVERLARRPWGAVVIDEAQQIKNPAAAQTEAVKRLAAPVRIALSGTPVENRLAEYWSVLDFANPGYLGPLAQFRAQYADPIERDRDPAALARFRQVTTPFLLRRLKTDPAVIADLPDKITQVEACALAPEQAALYQQVVDTQVAELAAAEPHARRGRMLTFMTAVKQVCNHPHHYLKRGTRAPEASGKAARLLELLDAALAAGERVLVFTQYREMGELLAEMIRGRFGFAAPFLHGGLSRAERDALVAGMQEGTGAPVLLLSLKAGGTGLNLTAANHVVHYDLWWNPAVEAQATDRAYRIGQARHVHVHRLVCAGTFEERIDLMLAGKRELADLTVGEGGGWLGELAEEVLASAL